MIYSIETIQEYQQDFERYFTSLELPEQYLPLVIDLCYPSLEQTLGYIGFCVSRNSFNFREVISIFHQSLMIIYRMYNSNLYLNDLNEIFAIFASKIPSSVYRNNNITLINIFSEMTNNHKKIFADHTLALFQQATKNAVINSEFLHLFSSYFGSKSVQTYLKLLVNTSENCKQRNEYITDYLNIYASELSVEEIRSILKACMYEHSGRLWPILTNIIGDQFIQLCENKLELGVLMCSQNTNKLTRLKPEIILNLVDLILKNYNINQQISQSLIAVAHMMYFQYPDNKDQWLDILAKIYLRCAFDHWEEIYEVWYEKNKIAKTTLSYSETRFQGYRIIVSEYLSKKRSSEEKQISTMSKVQLIDLMNKSDEVNSALVSRNSGFIYKKLYDDKSLKEDDLILVLNLLIKNRSHLEAWVQKKCQDLQPNEELPHSNTWIINIRLIASNLLNDSSLSMDSFYQLAKIFVQLVFSTEVYFKSPNEQAYMDFLTQCQMYLDQVNIDLLKSTWYQNILLYIPELKPTMTPIHHIIDHHSFTQEALTTVEPSSMPLYEKALTYGQLIYKKFPVQFKAIIDLGTITKDFWYIWKNIIQKTKLERESAYKIEQWLMSCEPPALDKPELDPTEILLTDNNGSYNFDNMFKINNGSLSTHVESQITFSLNSPGNTNSFNSFFRLESEKSNSPTKGDSVCVELN